MTNGYVIIDFGGKTIDDTGFTDLEVYNKIVNTNKPLMIKNANILASDNNSLACLPSFVVASQDGSSGTVYINYFENVIVIDSTGHVYIDTFA